MDKISYLKADIRNSLILGGVIFLIYFVLYLLETRQGFLTNLI